MTMQEVIVNSPRVVGYSCLEGIKCEIRNAKNAGKNKRQLLSQGEFYVLKFDKLSAQARKLLKTCSSLPHNNTNFPPLFDHANKLLYATRWQLEHIASCEETQFGRLIENII